MYEIWKMHTKFWFRKPKGRALVEDKGKNGMITWIKHTKFQKLALSLCSRRMKICPQDTVYTLSLASSNWFNKHSKYSLPFPLLKMKADRASVLQNVCVKSYILLFVNANQPAVYLSWYFAYMFCSVITLKELIIHDFTYPVYNTRWVEMFDATQHLVQKVRHPFMV